MNIRLASRAKGSLAAVAAFALVGTMAACSSGSSSEEQTTSDGSSGGQTTISFTAWDDLPDSFFAGFQEKYPDITVDFNRIPGDSYNQKLNQMVIGGQAPDVMLL
jgi:multiple sugar transport system substrate-binding protein